MPIGPHPHNPAPPGPTPWGRDAGLARIRRLTKGVAAAVAGGVVVATGYVAHALPGHHAAAGATLQPSPPPTTVAPSGGEDSAGGGSLGGGDDGGGPVEPGTAPLTPPTIAPRYSPPPTTPRTGSSPQVVSGSS